MRYTIFDVETRIDKSLVRAVYCPHAEVSDEDAYLQVRQRLQQEQGNDFFPLSFHIPVSIAVGQVNEEREIAEVDHGHLPDTAYPGQGAAREGVERRLDRLHGDHPGRERGLDHGAAEGAVEPARDDLDLRELGHGFSL